MRTSVGIKTQNKHLKKNLIIINNIEKGDIAIKIINPMRYKNGDS